MTGKYGDITLYREVTHVVLYFFLICRLFSFPAGFLFHSGGSVSNLLTSACGAHAGSFGTFVRPPRR